MLYVNVCLFFTHVGQCVSQDSELDSYNFGYHTHNYLIFTNVNLVKYKALLGKIFFYPIR